jgi:hypothetical protein
VTFFSERKNLTGKVLHARIRLVSGSFAQGAFQLHASRGDSFVFASSFLGQASRAPNRWWWHGSA